MPYLTKQLFNGFEVGITNCELVLPVRALRDLDDQAISAVVKELLEDFDYLKTYFQSSPVELGTIDEAKEYVREQEKLKRGREIKRELIAIRRRQFDARRAQLMLALIDKDGYMCKHPGCESQDDLTIDHIIPLSKGGTDDLSNLQFLCRKHNSAKGDN